MRGFLACYQVPEDTGNVRKKTSLPVKQLLLLRDSLTAAQVADALHETLNWQSIRSRREKQNNWADRFDPRKKKL
jgi:hypothetical protein